MQERERRSVAFEKIGDFNRGSNGFWRADNDISMLTSVNMEWRWEMAQKTAEKQPIM